MNGLSLNRDSLLDSRLINGIQDQLSGKATITTATIPRGRMRGDCNDDGLIDAADYLLLRDIILYGKESPDPGTEDFSAYDANGDGLINSSDSQVVLDISNDRIKPGRYAEITGNWTNNPNYETETAQFYCDIQVEGMTSTCDATVVTEFEYVDHAESINGGVRIWVTLCPVEALSCIVLWTEGDGVVEVINKPNTRDYTDTLITVTITASDWEDENENGSGYYTIEDSSIRSSCFGFLAEARPHNTAQHSRIIDSEISISSQSEGRLTLFANNKPTGGLLLLLFISPNKISSNVSIINLLPQPYAVVEDLNILSSYKADSVSISPNYNSSSTYAVGDYCTYEGKLYRCTTVITTAESWNSSHWTLTTVEEAFGGSSNTFIATYGTTTSAEIEAAYQAGREIRCVYNGDIYYLNNRLNNFAVSFTNGLSAATGVNKYVQCVNNAWANGSTQLALVNSPSFTGTPTAPTASAGTNTTQIATTAFVQNALSSSGVDNVAELWVWDKESLVTAHFELGTLLTNVFVAASATSSIPSTKSQWVVGDTVNVNSDSSFSLSNPTTVDLAWNSSGGNVLLGKYGYCTNTYKDGVLNIGELYYFPSDCVFNYSNAQRQGQDGVYYYYSIQASKSYKINLYADSYHHVSYETSLDSSTYPENAQSGDYWYKRLGQLGSGANPAELWVWEKKNINESIEDGTLFANITFVLNTVYTLYRTASVVDGNIELSDSINLTASSSWDDMSSYYYIQDGKNYHLGTRRLSGSTMYFYGNELFVKRTLDFVGYVTSSTSNAYPEDDRSGDYWYTRLGQIGGSFGGVKIETGSYVGTGTYGVNNKNSITFSFVPKIVLITASNAQSYGGNMLVLNGAENASVLGSSAGNNKIIFEDNNLQWYYLSGGNNSTYTYIQLNASNQVYNYIAIG